MYYYLQLMDEEWRQRVEQTTNQQEGYFTKPELLNRYNERNAPF